MMAIKAQRHISIHLQDDELGHENEACLICGNKALTQEYEIQSEPEIWMRQCHHCFLTSASRIPKPGVLQSYYESYYSSKTSQGGAEEKVTLSSVVLLAKRIASRFNLNKDTDTLHILDFGGGDGTLSKAVAKQLITTAPLKVEVTVVDVGGETVLESEANLTLMACRDIDECPVNSFDIVIASAVLEHLPDPGTVIKDLLDRLRKDGVFYARTPFHLQMAKALKRFGRRFDFGFPAHLHDMGDRFWENILSTLSLNNSFEIMHSSPSIVASNWRKQPLRTAVSYLIKSPRYLLGSRYKFVGGWEVVIRKL